MDSHTEWPGVESPWDREASDLLQAKKKQEEADEIEISLIQAKQSRLSASERRAVVRRVEMRRARALAAGGEG